VFPNRIKSWVVAYVNDLPILEAVYSEFGSSAFRGDPDENRREKLEQHTWAMKRMRNLRKSHHGLTKGVYRL
jgi:hypothetical protein